MTKMKGLLLGASAGLLTVASAQAADLPIKAKPVEYVKVCSLYGAGFFYIPGTDTCLKIGGYLRSDHVYGMANAGWLLYVEPGRPGNAAQTRTCTPTALVSTSRWTSVPSPTTGRSAPTRRSSRSRRMGDFAVANFTAQTNGSAGILRAFIQFAGFTVGHAVSYYDFMNGADYGYLPSVWSTGTGVNGTDLIAYTWQIGNGFSASIDIEDSGNGQNSPLAAAGVTTAGTPARVAARCCSTPRSRRRLVRPAT